MAQLQLGQEIKVRCAVSPGPFSEQRIVTFDTINGPISGFIDTDEVIQDQNGNSYVKGIVQSINQDDTVEVHINGSFFTTNGLAVVQRTKVAAA